MKCSVLVQGINYRLKGLVGVINRLFYKEPDILGTIQSIRRLTEGKSIARFGDGEFKLIFGKSLNFQEHDLILAKRLLEVLQSDEANLEIGLPKVFGSLKDYEVKSARFWRAYLSTNRKAILELVRNDKVYCNSTMTRFWSGYRDKTNVPEIINAFKGIWNNRELVFVEGELTRMGVGNDLFDNAKSIRRILCPAKNAWGRYEQILEEIRNRAWNKDTIFILALGPTATVLAYDLAKIKIQAIDLGHLDIQYEYFLKNAKGKVAIEGKYVNENMDGRNVSDEILDKAYENSILCRIVE